MSDGRYSPDEQIKRKVASDCYKRASEAMVKQNWSLAAEMFKRCVELVPENLIYRQTMAACLRKNRKDEKSE